MPVQREIVLDHLETPCDIKIKKPIKIFKEAVFTSIVFLLA